MLIIRNSSAPKQPGVKVTVPGSRQIRIAINAPLVKQASLLDFEYLALKKEGQRVWFIPTRRPEEYGGRVARLQRDGGNSSNKTASKALYLHTKFLNEVGFQAGRFYPANIGRDKFSISLAPAEPVPVSYAAPEEIPSGERGVYQIVDKDGAVIYVGKSATGTDVRGRVKENWKKCTEAASVLVCKLKSERECDHWERILHNRFEEEHGRLPRYCTLKGKGCGCPECNGGSGQIPSDKKHTLKKQEEAVVQSAKKMKVVTLSYGWERGGVRRYRIESITNSIDYHPRDFLTPDEVRTLCESEEWVVNILPERGSEP